MVVSYAKKSPFRKKTLGQGFRRDDGAVSDGACNVILAGPALNAGQLSQKIPI